MMSTNKTLTVVKSSPTKILPLPTSGHLHPIVSSSAMTTLTPHKILFRQVSYDTIFAVIKCFCLAFSLLIVVFSLLSKEILLLSCAY